MKESQLKKNMFYNHTIDENIVQFIEKIIQLGNTKDSTLVETIFNPLKQDSPLEGQKKATVFKS